MGSLFGEHPRNESLTWRAEPHYRGSFGILSSCLTTMILCIWTAIHLNIPERGHTVKNFLIKVGWLIMGIFAPEIIVWTAFQQRRDASDLTRREESSWTNTQSFYVLMGGFMIGSPYGTKGYNAIKPDGIDFFLREQDTENLAIRNRHQIEDKSKANNLAKLIVCLQVLWFCSQCIVRLAVGLPICLLELNTVAHAICAIYIYALWWDKPFNVEQPTFIPARGDLIPIQAYTYMNSTEGRVRRIGRHLPNTGYRDRNLRVDFNFMSSEEIRQRRQEQ
ncbi:uncharacterized protein BDR25DRAFT_298659 [Lindgomyces ingoldianus]|uniref:Uncharacterized protein n=1 Tax=Lindgomyces ingoldianus TaxID=673940 RepID=A0ACB6Q833_9PLEO|nr:uncharacterized protein BDR25DRAFT_298659 [Lindgomyces ingoldianus]KAF2463108.1 hypothetical protein BDR25DRAFT_298659 [Lindgomyces ingoldianus]